MQLLTSVGAQFIVILIENIDVMMEASKNIIIRHVFECPIFGHPRDFYGKASILTVSSYNCRITDRIVQLINAYHDSYYKLRMLYNHDKNKTSFKQKINKVGWKACLLFDIAGRKVCYCCRLYMQNTGCV